MNATENGAREVDSLIGANAELMDDIAPGAEGKAVLRGSVWTAHNLGDRQLDRGKRCTVEKVEGLKLFVR
jgi:membrane protein implicated in regulation of membrane protease activity